MKQKEMVVVLSWDEDDLGPKWMNVDNLSLLLYGTHATNPRALKVRCFEPVEER